MKKLLYSLRYPKIDIAGIDEYLDGFVTEEIKIQSKASQERFRQLLKSGKYEPIPGREKTKYRFIELTKSFSEDFCIDLDIREEETCIIADFYFDTAGYFTHLVSAMIMVDEIMVMLATSNGHAVLSLIYNTHSRLPKIHQ